jgi:DtxR family Mn-dependent transcriptional regulator
MKGREEEYLRVIWSLEEGGVNPVRVRDISAMLDVTPPSVVQMLHRLEAMGLIEYSKHRHVALPKRGGMQVPPSSGTTVLMEVLFGGVMEGSEDDVRDALVRRRALHHACHRGKALHLP